MDIDTCKTCGLYCPTCMLYDDPNTELCNGYFHNTFIEYPYCCEFDNLWGTDIWAPKLCKNYEHQFFFLSLVRLCILKTSDTVGFHDKDIDTMTIQFYYLKYTEYTYTYYNMKHEKAYYV